MQRRTRFIRDSRESNSRPLQDVAARRDVEVVPVAPVRPGSSTPTDGAVRGDGWVGEVERVGGRRRLRGEVVMLAAGLVFLAAALLKPWAGPVPARTPSPSTTPTPAAEIAAVPPPAVTSAPTVVPTPTYAPIPPYDYRWGFPFPAPSLAPGVSQPGVSVTTNYAWSAVDWSSLSAFDSDARWGFAAAAMTSSAGGFAGPSALAPTTSWVALGSPPVYAGVPLVTGQNVYAVAVTWPTNVIVKHVSFVYLGGPEHPVYLPPAAFLPDSSVTPLPAASVASGPAGSKIAANALLSGEFLIPPTSASFGPPPSSIGTAWRSSPWAWPYGAYQVTVTTTTGTRKSVLDLLLTD